MIPHGVDYQLFSNPTVASELLPQGKPIAGFYGSISAWLDLSLLHDDYQNANMAFRFLLGKLS